MAALAMQKALEMDIAEPQWRAERDRLLTTIPEQQSALLQVCLQPHASLSPQSCNESYLRDCDCYGMGV